MISRKLEMSGNGVDRGRVAERLRAAFAGLQELHHLREKQGDMVQRALHMDTDTERERTHTPCDACLHQSDKDTNRTDEQQRLEATLTTLKQQLVRKRKKQTRSRVLVWSTSANYS